jgi:transcriptional regulator with XRE-family HTH domain
MPTQKYVPHARLSCHAIQGIARTLKTLEERSGQSRESFARQIGVTPLTYRRLVAGKANPMILLLHSIACRLGITLEQLLGFEPLDPVASSEANAGQDARCETTQRATVRRRPTRRAA